MQLLAMCSMPTGRNRCSLQLPDSGLMTADVAMLTDGHVAQDVVSWLCLAVQHALS